MQQSMSRITSNPLKIRNIRKHRFLTICRKTPNGRVFHCCNKHTENGKHGRYFLPPKRWKRSLRDHK